MRICPLCSKEIALDGVNEPLTVCNICNSWLVETEFLKDDRMKLYQIGTPQPYTGTERRKDPRMEIRLPIKVCFELLLSGSSEGLASAFTCDIGGGGMLFESEQYASVSTIIETNIVLPDTTEVLRTLARIIRVKRHNSSYRTSVAFLRIDASHREKVNRFVEKLCQEER